MTAGYLSQLLRRSQSEIHRAAGKALVRPALSINGRDYYREADLQKIKAGLEAG